MSVVDLFTAVDAGDEDAVATQLAADAGLAAARDGEGVSATMHALYRRQPVIAERIAESLPALDVFEAAALGRTDPLRELLDRDPGHALAWSPDGFTALHYPGFFGRGDAGGATRLLMTAGADVNARSTNWLSVQPLHSALAAGNEEVAAILIDAGADVNATQRSGFTPLQEAAATGSVASVDRLLAAGADRAAMNDDGKTAADLAAEAGHAELAARLR
jgi:uncharacterized protein